MNPIQGRPTPFANNAPMMPVLLLPLVTFPISKKHSPQDYKVTQVADTVINKHKKTPRK